MDALALTPSRFKEYLKNVKELEVSCYQLERLVETLERLPSAARREISGLEHQIRTETAPEKPLSPAYNILVTLALNIFWMLLGAAACIAVAVVLRLLLSIFIPSLPWRPYIVWGAVAGALIAFGLLGLPAIKSAKETAKDYAAYPGRLEGYRKKQQQARRSIERWNMALEQLPIALEEGKATYQKTKELLDKYYDTGVIPPRHRGLVPVCTIYDYFENGEGASADTVPEYLGDILALYDGGDTSQYLFAWEIRTSLIKVEQLAQSFNCEDDDNILAQYYSDTASANAALLDWLQAWNASQPADTEPDPEPAAQPDAEPVAESDAEQKAGDT